VHHHIRIFQVELLSSDRGEAFADLPVQLGLERLGMARAAVREE